MFGFIPCFRLERHDEEAVLEKVMGRCDGKLEGMLSGHDAVNALAEVGTREKSNDRHCQY